MLTLSAIQSFFHADYSGTQQLLKQILKPIFGDYELGYDEITRSQTIKEKAKAAHIKTIKHVATFDAEGLQIKLFDVTLENNCHIHVARKNIQQLVREYVEKFEGAFIVFHYEHPEGRSWRLSYLEKRQNNAASTNAKRYTYLCGKDYPCRTIAERFDALQSQDLNAINLEKAFSVEALSDEFFTEYTTQYNNIFKYIYENRKDTTRFGEAFADCEDKFIRDYVKKMMGRITFLHFLQKKGWMGVPKNAEWGQGDVNFMYHLFEYANDEQKEDFLDLVLEPIFFNCLNKPRENDLFDTNVTKIGEVRIPYLNGGLFEKDEIDKPQSTLPKEIFENLLDFFARFNFTIDENDPLDAEVGVDPEMLGKIFENLLEDNKDKGAFYTPKEIVNYMCKESLIAYLVTEAQQACEVNKQRQENFEAAIRALVEDPEMTVSRIKRYDERQLEVLSRALMEVKICDPAIGSGAFPMGLLNLLFKCRNAVNNALGLSVPPAELKKDIIRNNIYGVDIEKGAIDIARLRFWLSIVVDLENPEALPNFDYKFMQGNSLLEQFAGVDLSDMFATKATEGKGSGVQLISFDEVSSSQTILLESLRHYFGMRTGEDKHQLRDKVNHAVVDLIRAKVNEAPELISKLQGLDVSANDQFFLWHTWFADVFNRPSKQGFDIVIGNPPYGANIDSLVKIYAKSYPKTSCGYKDIYKYFIECGFSLLKPNGFLTFITPNTFIRQPRYGDVRRLMLENNIWKIVDLGEDIFKAVVPVAIFLSQKCSGTKVLMADITKETDIRSAINNINYLELSQNIFETTVNNVFVKPVELNVQTKLLADILEMKDCGFKYQRSNVGLSQKGKNDLADRIFYTGELEDEKDIRILIGKDINTYYHSIHPNKVLRHNYNELLKENEGTYYNKLIMAAPTKLIWRQTAPYFIGTILKKSMFFGNTIQAGILRDEYQDLISYEYLCALLNSTYLRSLYIHNVQESGRVFPQVKLEKLKPLPIVVAKKEEQIKIESLVEKIITAKSLNPQADTADLEKQIDQLVYNLYGLNEDEIKLIEQA